MKGKLFTLGLFLMIKFKMEPVAQQSSEQEIAGGLVSIVSDDPPQKTLRKKGKNVTLHERLSKSRTFILGWCLHSL